MIKIIGINASERRVDDPRSQQESLTRKLLAFGLDHLSSTYDDVHTGIIDLRDYKLNFDSCAYSTNEGLTPLAILSGDDASVLLNKFTEADGVIFSTPVHWLNMSARLMCLFERLTALDAISDNSDDRKLQGKVAGAISTAKFDGSSAVAYQVLRTANYLGFTIPPHAIAFHTGRTTSSVMESAAELDEDYFAFRNAQSVAENVYRMTKLTKGAAWHNFQEFTVELAPQSETKPYNHQRERLWFDQNGGFRQKNKAKGFVRNDKVGSVENLLKDH